MSTFLAIFKLGRAPLRIGKTGLPNNGQTVEVDLDDPVVRRDLQHHTGRWMAGGSKISQSFTVSSATHDFVAEFDLGGVRAVMVKTTLLSVNYDTTTPGFGAGQTAFDIEYMYTAETQAEFDTQTTNKMGIGGTVSAPSAFDYDNPYIGNGSDLPLLTHREHGVAMRYVRVKGHAMDGATFDTYVGVRHPVATWRIDIESA